MEHCMQLDTENSSTTQATKVR